MREKSQEPRSKSQESGGKNKERRARNQNSEKKSQEPRSKNQDKKDKIFVQDILPLIPQKPPFVMVDRLVCSDERITKSSFLISADNVMVKNNFFQEAGLMENIAQTAALRAAYTASLENRAVERGYIVSIKDFEVLRLPSVNDELLTEITIENQVFDITVFSGKVWAGDALIAGAEMKVMTGNNNYTDEQ